jgi:hypothetical protein
MEFSQFEKIFAANMKLPEGSWAAAACQWSARAVFDAIH